MTNDRIGIDTNGMSEQPVTECDSCDLRSECWSNDERINDANWCMKDCMSFDDMDEMEGV